MTRRRAAVLLFGAFTVDMMFLPMFHIGTVPFKPMYLALGLYIPGAVLRRVVQPVTVLWWLLAASCLVGGVYLHSMYGTAELKDTLRNCLVFFLVPLAFAFGSSIRLARLDVLAWLLPAYFLLNLTVTFGHQQLPWLIGFYGLEFWVERGLFDVRSPGVHFNANLSALAANLMFLGVIMADRYGALRIRGRLSAWLVFLSVMGVHVMMGSRGETLTALILGAAWVSCRSDDTARRQIVRRGIRLLGAGLVVLLLLAVGLPWLATYFPMFTWFYGQLTSATSMFQIEQLWDPALRGDSVFMRPFMEMERVVARFKASPIWGTGFDVVPNVPPFDYTYFHNDWAVVAVAGGLIGLALFAFGVRRFARLGWPMLIPFLLAGLANSFILAPQHLVFYAAVAGWLAQRRRIQRVWPRPAQVNIQPTATAPVALASATGGHHR